MRSLALITLLAPLTLTPSARAQEPKPADKPAFAGPSEQGFLLPNGWRLTPAGKQVLLTDLPLNFLVDADGRHALVATGGYNAHELTAIDLATHKKAASQSTRHTWFGLALEHSSGRLWWSGGGSSVLHNYTWKDGKLEAGSDFPPALKPGEAAPPDAPPAGFRTGMCLDQETGAPKGQLGAGEFFGEIALIAERSRTATITALAPCKLLLLHKDDFKSFMDAHPDLKDAVRVAAKRRLEELKA